MTGEQKRKTRLIAVTTGVFGAIAIWVVAELVLGLDLRSPVFEGGGESFDIGPLAVGLTALIASVAGWAVLAVLERVTTRAAAIWLVASVLALLASLTMPLSGTGLDSAQRAGLLAMHLAVGAAIIPALYATSRWANDQRDQKEASRGSLHAA